MFKKNIKKHIWTCPYLGWWVVQERVKIHLLDGIQIKHLYDILKLQVTMNLYLLNFKPKA